MLEQQIYDTLKRHNVCSSEEQFSVEFLEKSKKYFGVCKARNGQVSLSARVMLLERIRRLEEVSANQSKTALNEKRGRLISLATDLANLRRKLGQDLSKQCLEGFTLK